MQSLFGVRGRAHLHEPCRRSFLRQHGRAPNSQSCLRFPSDDPGHVNSTTDHVCRTHLTLGSFWHGGRCSFVALLFLDYQGLSSFLVNKNLFLFLQGEQHRKTEPWPSTRGSSEEHPAPSTPNSSPKPGVTKKKVKYIIPYPNLGFLNFFYPLNCLAITHLSFDNFGWM